MSDMKRCSRVRRTGSRTERFCAAYSRCPTAKSFTSGITMLATKMITASAHEPFAAPMDPRSVTWPLTPT